MARIFITGSSDGLGLRSAKALTKRGHDVYLHARNSQRAEDARAACPDAKDVFVADLTSTEETKALAAKLNQTGPWDTIIQNAGVMYGVGKGKEGIPALFAINTVAPYILTCLVDPPPKRYIFIGSALHYGGDSSLRNLQQSGYSDSKLHDIMLALWFARRLANKGVLSNVLNPGWVPTKLSGWGATNDMGAAIDNYVLLAEGKGVADGVTGKYWYHSRYGSPGKSGRETGYQTAADDEARQNQLIEALEKVSGVQPP
ncbi:sporulation-induced protein [Hypoxylon texense]